MSKIHIKEQFKEVALDWFQKGVQFGCNQGTSFEEEWKRETFQIETKEHHVVENQQIIEISDESGLVATIVPRKREITILSKYFRGVEVDKDYPPKVIIKIENLISIE